MPIGVRWSGQVTADSQRTISWITAFSANQPEGSSEEGACSFPVSLNESAETAASALMAAYNDQNEDSSAWLGDDKVSVYFNPPGIGSSVENMTVDSKAVTESGLPVYGLTATRTGDS